MGNSQGSLLVKLRSFMNPKAKMISDIKTRYGLNSPRVFSAMLQVPREEFVSQKDKDIAYSDTALSIGFGQTISQPYTVAFMTYLVSSSLSPSLRKKILEVGTGSGYQAAILSLLFDEVYTVEIIPELASEAAKKLKGLGFKNVQVKTGSGEFGWKTKSPFDAILVTAGIGDGIPKELLNQLKAGGVMVAPIGEGPDKKMTRFIKKKGGKFKKKEFGVFRFVPFIESN